MLLSPFALCCFDCFVALPGAGELESLDVDDAVWSLGRMLGSRTDISELLAVLLRSMSRCDSCLEE